MSLWTAKLRPTLPACGRHEPLDQDLVVAEVLDADAAELLGCGEAEQPDRARGREDLAGCDAGVLPGVDVGGDLLGGEVGGQLAEGEVVVVVVHALHAPKARHAAASPGRYVSR